MPYTNISEMPEYTHKYSSKVRRQMMHVFNSTYSKVLKDTTSKKQAEVRAFKAANSILKKRFKKTNAYNSADYFNHLVDGWLGNLPG